MLGNLDIVETNDRNIFGNAVSPIDDPVFAQGQALVAQCRTEPHQPGIRQGVAAPLRIRPFLLPVWGPASPVAQGSFARGLRGCASSWREPR